MKIVRVIARLNVGGPAKHVVWLTCGLQTGEPLDDPQKACESLLVAGTVPPGEDDMGYFATENGVTPIFVPEMSREISFKDAVTVWKLYKLFRRERPDIVHTHTAKAGTVGRVAGFCYRWFTPGALLGRPRACRFVHTYHGHIFHSYYGPLKTRAFLLIEKALARLITDRIVVISEQQRREINEEFGVGRSRQFSVVPLGLDLGDFANWRERGQSFREELQLGSDDVLVGIVGRLTEIKNHELFLRAAAEFKKDFAAQVKSDFVAQSPKSQKARVCFVIIGDGALRNALEQHAAALGLQADVIFTGSRRDVENVYPALDVVALTSRNEGTPLTLIEAMANARPVISTAVGGVVDLLGDPVRTGSGPGSPRGQPAWGGGSDRVPVKTANGSDRVPVVSSVSQTGNSPFQICARGISVPPGDASAFAAGLARLVSDATLRRETGERGLQFVTTLYSKERLLDDIKNLYKELLMSQSEN